MDLSVMTRDCWRTALGTVVTGWHSIIKSVIWTLSTHLVVKCHAECALKVQHRTVTAHHCPCTICIWSCRTHISVASNPSGSPSIAETSAAGAGFWWLVKLESVPLQSVRVTVTIGPQSKFCCDISQFAVIRTDIKSIVGVFLPTVWSSSGGNND